MNEATHLPKSEKPEEIQVDTDWIKPGSAKDREDLIKLLVEKGANPNHQNKGGQTAGHFANAYQFYDFLSWLFDPNGGGADDTLENMYGLGPYDGLSVELENG